MSFSEYFIPVEHLCVGLFIRLDAPAPGLEELGRAFKVSSEEQIRILRRSGASRVLCVVNKSDRLPGAPGAETAPEAKPKRFKTPVSLELQGLKRETLEKNRERKERYNRCRDRYEASMTKVSDLLKRASAKSTEAAGEAAEVVDELVETFHADADVLISLMNTKPKEEFGHYHALNVTVLSMILGKALKLSAHEMRILGQGALFHDVGKGRMPINELERGKATTLKYAVQKYYEQHPVMGAQIAKSFPNFPQESLRVILEHHESCDGKGFPRRLSGDKIHPLAKIVGLVDRYDNLLNEERPDKTRITPHEAVKTVHRMREVFDQRLAVLFIKSVGVYPPGTVVSLSNAMTGVVVSANPKTPDRPHVLVHHPEIPKAEAIVVDLSIEPDIAVRGAIRPEELPRDVFNYLSPGRQMAYFADSAES